MVISCFKRENCKGNMEYRDQKDAVITRAFDDYSKLSKSSNSSKSSMTSSLKSAKRKKKEFYLSRSRSEISLNSLKHICKNKNIKPLPKIEIKKTLSTQMSIQNLGQNKFDSSNMLRDQDSSKIILNYFTRILYEMIMRQMSQDQRCKEVAKNVDPQINICIGTENTSLQELYRKSPNNNIGVAHKVNNKLDVKNSCYDLKAKQSEYCFVQPNKRKSKHLYIFNNLALQTSTIFLDNKNCQTSKTLLAYILNSNVHTENFNFKKKRIFKKTYNCENVLGLPNSCDEIENFVVTFDSDHSFSSNFSERDFMLSNSGCSSRQLTESGQEDSLSQSLIKLKETLERYEHIKNEIARKSLQEANINPIEYFVYQVCACNNDKLNKKSSVMQKIVSKTKGLFSSVEKDMCRKYKNQRNFLNLPQTGREELCFNCGCYFPKSAYNTPGKKPTAMQLICQCPQNNKTKQRTSEPCCKKNNKPKAASNFSRLASASASSLKSLKDCLKKSVSEIFNNGNKNNSLGPCRCGRKVAEKKNVDTICIPEDMHVVICNKKDTSTSTTKDSSTQKCECGKCANFADDGTCCCSHCLGCLDKSFEAKPQNNNVGVETDAKKKHTSQMNKGGQTSDSLERKSKSNKTSSVSDLKVTEQNSKQLETEKEDTISIDTQPGSLADADTTHVPGTIQEVNETDNDITLTSENVNRSEPPKNEIQSKDSRSEKIEHPVETIEDNDAENDDDGNDTTAAYFFVAPPPHLFQQFRLGNGNPFDQYLLNFPQVFHVDRAD